MYEFFETNAEREEREAVQAGALRYADEEWDEEGDDNACCGDSFVAARRLCGCRGA